MIADAAEWNFRMDGKSFLRAGAALTRADRV
jgi:hypothetical protein